MSSLRQVGQYRIEEILYSRTDAEVFRAADTIRKRTATLWVLKPGIYPDAAALQRFLHEVEAAADLVHPHLAWVWEIGEAEGLHFVVERYVEGATLRRHLDEHRALGWSAAEAAIEQLAQGLDFAHNRGAVHGSIRPEHIYLSRELGAVLGGFGAPRPPHQGLEAAAKDLDAARYWAPELWRGDRPSPASDRYALACVFAEMLSGRPLFSGSTPEAVRAGHLGEAILPADLPPETPLEFEPALERGLAKEPALRYASAVELASAPARLAQAGALDPNERSRREAQRLLRQEAAEQSRRDAEEAARLAALEQARREVEAAAPHLPEPELESSIKTLTETDQTVNQDSAGVQLDTAARGIRPRKDSTAGAASDSPLPIQDAVDDAQPEGVSTSDLPGAIRPTAPRRRSARRRSSFARTAGLLLLALLIGFLWIGFSRGWFLAPSATPTPVPPTFTLPAAADSAVPTVTSSPSPMPTFTPTHTASPTATLQPSITPSRTPTRTPEPSSTPTRLPPPTSTNAPRDRGND